jgi:hypothetical protein
MARQAAERVRDCRRALRETQQSVLDTEMELHERFRKLGELQGRAPASSAESAGTRGCRRHIVCRRGIRGKYQTS